MTKIQDSNAKFLFRVNKYLEIVKEHKTINRFVVCRLLMITPKQYELLHPYLVEAYADKIEYNPNRKEWTWIEKEVETPSTP